MNESKSQLTGISEQSATVVVNLSISMNESKSQLAAMSPPEFLRCSKSQYFNE